MNASDKEINTIIMQEIGLEIGENNRIYDQDTGVKITINNMDVIAPGNHCDKQSIEFDPHNNRKLMSQLFGYFLDKHSEETDIDILAYYNVDDGKNGYIECRMSNNELISSKSYQRDSLKYTDIIMRLNGETNTDELEKFDTPIERKSILNEKDKLK